MDLYVVVALLHCPGQGCLVLAEACLPACVGRLCRRPCGLQCPLVCCLPGGVLLPEGRELPLPV